MKIKIKLKPDEILAMLDLLSSYIQKGNRADKMGALVHILIVRMYVLFKQRSIMLYKPVSITVPGEMAMAFCLAFNGQEISQSPFITNVALRLISIFDQKTICYDNY